MRNTRSSERTGRLKGLATGLAIAMGLIFTMARIAAASNESGGSIAVIASSWNMWFGTMSRRAPVFS